MSDITATPLPLSNTLICDRIFNASKYCEFESDGFGGMRQSKKHSLNNRHQIFTTHWEI